MREQKVEQRAEKGENVTGIKQVEQNKHTERHDKFGR